MLFYCHLIFLMHHHHSEYDQSLFNVPDELFHEYLHSDEGTDDDFSFPSSPQHPPVFNAPLQFGQPAPPPRFPAPLPNQGPNPPFPPPTIVWNYTPFKNLDEACYIVNNISDKNMSFIAIPLTAFSSIRNDRRRPPIPGYIIHH